MDWSRIAVAVRSARERAGWSREALAYHSGLSWGAIAQIESGRRQEVRASSLVALAEALQVSVDYLVGGAAPTRLLAHRALVHGSDDEYLAATVPFLRDGVRRSESALAVTSERQMRLLRDALGDDASRVEFRDSTEWYSSPRQALEGYRSFVRQRVEAGAPWVRVVGEPVWAGRSRAEIAEWMRYESIINLSLAASPATIMCPYDARSLPKRVVDSAHRNHPEVVSAGTAAPSPAYHDPEDALLRR